MRLGIMQPYLFPYLGYFQLIHDVDKWVVFDEVQYISKGWVNRNRILHPDKEKEWQYITVPVEKHSKKDKINQIRINNSISWQEEILGKLTSYKKKAPYYKETINFVSDCIYRENVYLSDFLTSVLESTCEHIGIPFQYSLFSEMDLNIDNIEHAGQWAVEIADVLGANEYINPEGGYKIFREEEFIERDISLRFLQSKLPQYVQRRGGFVSGLSIIDVMMWNNENEIKEMLKEYSLLSYTDISSF